MADVDPDLRRYRVDTHSLAVGFPEPASVYKLTKEFEDNFGEDVPFRRFGYMSFEAFLNDHPDLERVYLDGKPCYRAKISERTADIQSLVSRQKKKKKKGNNKKTRGHFQRNVQTRSFHVRPNMNSYNGAPFNNSNFQRSSYRGRGGGPVQPQNFSRASFTAFNRPPSGFGMPNPSFAPSFARPQPPRPFPMPQPIVQQPADPATGKARILSALKQCGGKATLTKLNYAYQSVFKTQMDGNEMKKYFKTSNFKSIHTEYLADEMEFKSNEAGQWTFISKEIAKQQQEWAASHQNVVVSETPRPRWDKPTLKELYDKVVAMLVNMYPSSFNVSSMAEIYKRAHVVNVDPEELYCKSWVDLVKTTFSDKLSLKPDGSVVLTEKAERDHGLRKSAPAAAVTNTVKRVTAGDLGLQCSDESDDESDDDDDDTNSLTSTSTMSSRSTLNRSNIPMNDSRRSVFDAIHNPSDSRLSQSSSNYAPQRNLLQQPQTVQSLDSKAVDPVPEKKNIFSRISRAFKSEDKTGKSVSVFDGVFNNYNTKNDVRKTGYEDRDNVQKMENTLAKCHLGTNSGFGSSSNSQTQNVSSDSTQKKSAFGFISSFGKSGGFGAAKSSGFGAKMPETNSQSTMSSSFGSGSARLEIPYGMCPAPAASNSGNQNVYCVLGESNSGIVLSPGAFQVKLPESVIARLTNNRITRRLPGLATETDIGPHINGGNLREPRGL